MDTIPQLLACAICGGKVARKASVCPHCGALPEDFTPVSVKIVLQKVQYEAEQKEREARLKDLPYVSDKEMKQYREAHDKWENAMYYTERLCIATGILAVLWGVIADIGWLMLVGIFIPIIVYKIMDGMEPVSPYDSKSENYGGG